MKNLGLLALLAASLSGNVWLAHRFLNPNRPAADSTNTAAATSSKNSSAQTAPTAAKPVAASARKPVPVVWTAPGASNADLRQLADKLRAAGFPPRVVAAIVTTYLRDRAYAKVGELPFWQLVNPGQAARELQASAARELQQLQEDVLGLDGRPAALLNPFQRTRQYGNLGDDKIDALLKIERDYRELANSFTNPAGSSSAAEFRERQEKRAALESEKQADIAATLTPEEFAAYELRSSPSANRVMNNLRNLTVSEEEYAALFQLQKAYDAKAGTFTTYSATSPEERAKAQTARFELNEQLRLVLPEASFYKYLETSDYSYGEVARFAEKQPALTPTSTYALYQLQSEANTVMGNFSDRMRTTQGSAEAMKKLSEERRAAQADLNTRLETLLGQEAADAFRKQGNGQYLFQKPTPPKG